LEGKGFTENGSLVKIRRLKNEKEEMTMSRIRFAALFMAALFAFTGTVSAITAEELAKKHRIKLWTFETGTLEGWYGENKFSKALSVTNDPKFVTEGKYAMKTDLTGSNDWNQEIMRNRGPFHADINKLVELSFDCIVPEATMKGLEYGEIYLVFSSQSNAWYSLKSALVPGKQTISYKIENQRIAKDMWDVYLVINSSQPFKGPIYIDNIQGRILGPPGNIEGVIKDSDGKGIKDAYVVVGEQLARTGNDGKFRMRVPEDAYRMAVVAYGYRDKGQDVMVLANQTNNLGEITLVKQREPKETAVKVSLDPSKVIRTFDPHKLYGQNVAAWHRPEGYRDNEALKRMKQIGATFIRLPGGDYGNEYDWRTGNVFRHDGTVRWTPDFNYMGGMAPFIRRLDSMWGGNKVEALPIINVMSPLSKTIEQRVNYQIEWLQDMKNKGIRFKYVEVGNEPDSKGAVPGPGKPKEGQPWYQAANDPKVLRWWSSIENYSKVFNYTSQKIKKAFPNDNLLLMGPCTMQPMNQEMLDGRPWQADAKSPVWVEKFLQLSGKHVDTLVVHEYPFWANNDARALLKKPQETWPVYMPKFRDWIKKHVNSIKGRENDYIEVALTEWNSGDENIMTAMLENSLFCADYLGEFIRQGGDLALIWDLYTQKPGLGGGHGLMDSENDPTDKFSRRGHYWVFDLYYNRFGTKVIDAKSDYENLSVHATMLDDRTIALMAINKSKFDIASAKIDIKGFKPSTTAKSWQFSEKEYVWSRELYRPIVNTGPTEFNARLGDSNSYNFPPYSITVMHLKK